MKQRPAVTNFVTGKSGLEQASEHAKVIHPAHDGDTEDEEHFFIYEPYLFKEIETRLEVDESLTGVEEDISDADLGAAANQYDRSAIPDVLPERWHILQIDFIAECPNGSLEETTSRKRLPLLQEYFEAYPDEREQFDSHQTRQSRLYEAWFAYYETVPAVGATSHPVHLDTKHKN
ncbi:hypothetical protein DL770_004069 [Monosporascus sp. CRB-9-2]|nr:hypothetical protein DL770_004069 [Monosporascus sp. CRB-9-2]